MYADMELQQAMKGKRGKKLRKFFFLGYVCFFFPRACGVTKGDEGNALQTEIFSFVCSLGALFTKK